MKNLSLLALQSTYDILFVKITNINPCMDSETKKNRTIRLSIILSNMEPYKTVDTMYQADPYH